MSIICISAFQITNHILMALRQTSCKAVPNAIPRTQVKGKFARSEAEVLENLRLNFFEDLEVPVEDEPGVREVRQLD